MCAMPAWENSFLVSCCNNEEFPKSMVMKKVFASGCNVDDKIRLIKYRWVFFALEKMLL